MTARIHQVEHSLSGVRGGDGVKFGGSYLEIHS